MVSKFILIDNSIIGLVGHHYEYAVRVLRAAEEAGIKGIFVHGRTKVQGYKGRVDYATIRQVKGAVKVPVIGSGDVLTASLAQTMLDETGCDGIAIARGALGNPWIFQEITRFAQGDGNGPRPVRPAIIEVMRRHFLMCADFYGERNGVIIFRKFFAWYTRGFRKVRALREEVSRIKTKDQMLVVFASCLDMKNPRLPSGDYS